MNVNSLFIHDNGQFHQIAKSSLGQNILMQRIGSGEKNILIVGGVHGDEIEGVQLTQNLISYLKQQKLPPKLSVFIIPVFNQDGFHKNDRCNSRGVDLNRNMPTNDWDPIAHKVRYNPGPYAGSEIETQLMIDLIATLKPLFIISNHSYEIAMINTNGDCKILAEAMHSINGLPIKDHIGYPTPGSLGIYAGIERKIPTITLELLKGDSSPETLQKNCQAILKGIKAFTS